MECSSGDGSADTVAVRYSSRTADPGDSGAGDGLQVPVIEVNDTVIPMGSTDGTRVPIAGGNKWKKRWRKMCKWCRDKADQAERMYQSLRNSKAGKVMYAIGVIINCLYKIYRVIECLAVCLNV